MASFGYMNYGHIRNGESVILGWGVNHDTVTLHRQGNVYSCSCLDWHKQRRPFDVRTCVHLMCFMGTWFELERIRLGGLEKLPRSVTKAIAIALPHHVVYPHKNVSQENRPYGVLAGHMQRVDAALEAELNLERAPRLTKEKPLPQRQYLVLLAVAAACTRDDCEGLCGDGYYHNANLENIAPAYALKRKGLIRSNPQGRGVWHVTAKGRHVLSIPRGVK